MALLLSCLVLILTACSDKEDPAPEYSPGLIRINANMLTSEVFDLVNGYNLTIETFDPQILYTAFTSDSIPFIVRELELKAYFPNFSEYSITTGFGNPSPEGLSVFTNLVGMTVANQQDWLQTMAKLRLQEADMGKQLLLSVPVGSEQEWVDVLKANSRISYAGRKFKYETECATPTSDFPF